jgi:hypothetical protein
MADSSTIYDYFDKHLNKLGVEIPSVGEIDPDTIGSGSLTSTLGQATGNLYTGKEEFSNTTAGYILGVDGADGLGKFYIGDSTNYLNWDGTNLTLSGSISAGAINIGGADATSWHVDATGNMWSGAAIIGTAPFSVTNVGLITATSGTISGWTLGTTQFSGTGVAFSSAGDAYISFGTTPPTSPTVGTGIFINKTGLYGLSTDTQNFKIDATNGSITAISGTIANWTISSSALYTGAFDTFGTMYFGTSGISISDAFKVTAVGAITANSGIIGGFTLGATEMYGGTIKTSGTVGIGSNGVIMDSAGLRGYDAILGNTFNLPTNGGAPTFSSGIINETIFEISTNAVLRTSDTVGDGSANSAGVLINNTGVYGCGPNQTPATANFRILNDGGGSIVLGPNGFIRGGQTDYNTGIGWFEGYTGGEYKLSIGNPDGDHFNWDGSHIKMKGSFDVGTGGVINNSVYTVATLPVAPTVVGFSPPSNYE